MRWLDIIRLRLRSLAQRNRVEEELDDELRFHVETLTDRYVQSGMDSREARRRALIETGGVEGVKEQCRDARRVSTFEHLTRDVVYGLRAFSRSPGFVATAVIAIALGIGANTALFSIVYSLMYRPLPVAHPETIRNIHVTTFGEGGRSGFGTPYNVSWAEFNHIRGGAKTAEIAGVAENSLSLRGDARQVRVHLVSDNFLETMGAVPVLGRFIRPEEASKPGSEAVVVLSYAMWRDRMHSDPNVVGRTLVLNRTPFTVLGVADERTTGPLIIVPDAWIPLTMQPITRPGETLIDKPHAAWIQLFGRLKPGYDDATMSAEMSLLAQQALTPHLPKRKAQVEVAEGSFFNFPFVRKQFRPMLLVLVLAVGLVLIVACANVANMLLARGLVRRREIAIRLSIGAGRCRLLQQLLTESVLLALLGGAVGMLLASWGAQALAAMIPVEQVGRHQVDLSPDGRVMLWTVGISLFTGIVFGLLPAIHAIRFDLSPALKADGLNASQTGSRRRLQSALIAVQVAVCLVLLTGAGLLLRGFRHAVTMDPGQSTRNVLIADFDFRAQQYTGEKAERFVRTFADKARELPGVTSISTTFIEPLHDQCGTGVRIPGPDGKEGPERIASCDEVGPDFFRTAGIRLLSGREFTAADAVGKAPVAIVDDRFARDHFGTDQVLGRSFVSDRQTYEIIGVAARTTPLDVNGFGAGKVYTPMRGLRFMETKMLLSYAGASADVEQALRREAASLDAGLTVSVKRIEESIENALVPARMAIAAASTLGGLAVILACTGIYGLVAFAIGRRRQEIGIRMALGASRGKVLASVMWDSMKPVLAGGVVGLALAAGAGQLLRAMLYGISPLDPISFLGTSALLATVAAVAAAIPARAALRVNPALTLRQD